MPKCEECDNDASCDHCDRCDECCECGGYADYPPIESHVEQNRSIRRSPAGYSDEKIVEKKVKQKTLEGLK